MELEIIKNRINSEKKYGDVEKACDKANVSRTVFNTAMEKSSYDDLTDGECNTLTAMLEVLDDRKQSRERLIESAK